MTRDAMTTVACDAVGPQSVPGMDVCLLVTYVHPTGISPHGTRVMRSVVTQTDVSGKFFFAR